MGEQMTLKVNCSWANRTSSKISWNSVWYIGHEKSSGTTVGSNIGILQIARPTTLPNNLKVISFTLGIRTVTSSSGWNGCVASVNSTSDTAWSTTIYHTFTPTWSIAETNGWKTWTTTDADDMAYLRTLLTDSSVGYIYIQLRRVSGCGSKISGSYTPYMSFVYEEGGILYVYDSGWKEATPYIAVKPAYGDTVNPLLTRPAVAMTSNSSQGYTVTASSQYNTTNYLAYKVFNGTNSSNTDCWCSATSDTSPWIQIIWDIPLYNVDVTIANRAGNYCHAVIAGTINGIDASGTTLISTNFSGRNNTISEANTYSFSNNTAIQGIKIVVTEYNKTEGSKTVNYCSIGQITITGFEFSPDVLGWKECTAYIYTSNGWV